MKKGEAVVMKFSYAGLVSEEDCEVVTVHKDKTVTLDNDYRFSIEDGRCINDNTFGGARRSLKLSV